MRLFMLRGDVGVGHVLCLGARRGKSPLATVWGCGAFRFVYGECHLEVV